jgi:uncharacterized protein YndB with AHSA1/START domain
MSRWFFPGSGRAVVAADFRKGGKYQNEMILNGLEHEGPGCGSVSESGSYMHNGEYLEIVPPERLVFTWNSHLVKDSRVTIELRDLGDSTELTLTHDLLETEDLRVKHNGGWEGCLTNLAKYLE